MWAMWTRIWWGAPRHQPQPHQPEAAEALQDLVMGLCAGPVGRDDALVALRRGDGQVDDPGGGRGLPPRWPGRPGQSPACGRYCAAGPSYKACLAAAMRPLVPPSSRVMSAPPGRPDRFQQRVPRSGRPPRRCRWTASRRACSGSAGPRPHRRCPALGRFPTTLRPPRSSPTSTASRSPVWTGAMVFTRTPLSRMPRGRSLMRG